MLPHPFYTIRGFRCAQTLFCLYILFFVLLYKSGDITWELFLPTRAARVEPFLFRFRPTRIQIVSGSSFTLFSLFLLYGPTTNSVCVLYCPFSEFVFEKGALQGVFLHLRHVYYYLTTVHMSLDQSVVFLARSAGQLLSYFY